MNVLVSPYHLTTREPAAMAAVALARRVVTVVPSAEGTARALPAFARFAKSWSWSVPLWKAGVLGGEYGGLSPEVDVVEATRHIQRDAGCVSIRHFLHEHGDERAYLTALANDLMKGGPDPGISLPVAAGLDRFAARTGCVVARGAAASLAQRAEASLAVPVFNVVVPVFVQATAERVLHYREVLAEEVARLGAAVEPLASSGAGGSGETASLARDVQASAAALAAAFETTREELFLGASDDDVRPVAGAVSLSGVRLPWDAVLTSSVRAVEHLSPALHGAAGGLSQAGAGTSTLPVVRDAVAGKTVLSIVVRPVGRSAGRG